jgi:UDP:flavonoid glycosyltransferase YjiC (YdhE family)
MRMLFATTANEGHFGPLAALAVACAASGHEVRVAAPESFAAAVQRRRLVHLPFADAPQHLVGPLMARLPELSFEDANAVVVREVFAGVDARAAHAGVVEIVESWRPHVVIRDPAEYASLAASVRAGVPHLTVAIGMTEMVVAMAGLAEPGLVDLARAAGLDDDALPVAERSAPALSSVPESLDRAGDPAYRDGVITMRYREPAPAGSAPLPDFGSPELPLVYVTFGSVTGSLAPFSGVYRQALDGLADLPARVFMTIGHRMDVNQLGPIRPNTRVERWWPQADVLAAASVVVGHGGFGTTMGGVLAGVPQMVAPLFTLDQAINARHIQSSGAGRGLGPGPDVVARACAEVSSLLTDPSARTAAAALATDARALPPISVAVDFIAQFAG